MLLYLNIKPNQRFNRVEESDGKWIIRVKAPAIDGRANEHLIDYLSEVLNLPKSAVRLKKGKTSRIKCLEIDAEVAYVHENLRKAASLHIRM